MRRGSRPKAIGAQTRARAAGLKMCSRWQLHLGRVKRAQHIGALEIEADGGAVGCDQESAYALFLEEFEPAFAAEHHGRGRQPVGGHRRGRHDRDAGEASDGLARARVQDVAFGTDTRRAAFVVARSTHRDL